VGNVTVELKGINEKHNQFSAAVTIEDRRFEKKNRAMNEPIFFYLSGTHIPEEIVVNKVGKNTISGYLSIPKANSQTAAPRRQSLATKFSSSGRGVCRARDEAGRTICPPFFRGAQVIFRIPVE